MIFSKNKSPIYKHKHSINTALQSFFEIKKTKISNQTPNKLKKVGYLNIDSLLYHFKKLFYNLTSFPFLSPGILVFTIDFGCKSSKTFKASST